MQTAHEPLAQSVADQAALNEATVGPKQTGGGATSPSGGDVAQIAASLAANPQRRTEVIAKLQKDRGNSFVQEVLKLESQGDEGKAQEDQLEAGMLVHRVVTGKESLIVEGTQPFKQAVYAAMLKLASKPTGATLLLQLLEAPVKTVIGFEVAQAYSSRLGGDQKAGTIGEYATNGEPTATKVMVDPGLQVKLADNCADYAPFFLILGHELIHSMHSGMGRNQRDHDPLHGSYSNREEEITISGGPQPHIPSEQHASAVPDFLSQSHPTRGVDETKITEHGISKEHGLPLRTHHGATPHPDTNARKETLQRYDGAC